jgi:hypothetical protein
MVAGGIASLAPPPSQPARVIQGLGDRDGGGSTTGGDFDCSEPKKVTSGDGHAPDPPSGELNVSQPFMNSAKSEWVGVLDR